MCESLTRVSHMYVHVIVHRLNLACCYSYYHNSDMRLFIHFNSVKPRGFHKTSQTGINSDMRLFIHFGRVKPRRFHIKQDACTGVHSTYRREENGHNLDRFACVLRRLRLTQRRMQEFLGLKLGRGLHLQIWDLNRAHETERTVFPIPQVFSMCRRRL